MRCDDDHGLKDPLNVSLKELEEDETGESWKTDKEGKSGWVGGGSSLSGWLRGLDSLKWKLTRGIECHQTAGLVRRNS